MNIRLYLTPAKPYAKGDTGYIDFTPPSGDKPPVAVVNCSGPFSVSLLELVEATIVMTRLAEVYDELNVILQSYLTKKGGD